MTDYVFNAETYAETLRLAGNAWRNAEGKGDNACRTMLAAIVNSALTPLAVALTVYEEMQPRNAKGKLAEPKESEKASGGVSVSSLRNAKGGEGARSALEAVFYVADNRSEDANAVAAFIRGDAGAMRLFRLKAHLQACKLKATKEANEAAGVVAETDKEGEDVVQTVDANPLTAAAAFIASLDGEALVANADAIETLLAACRDASERLAAADAVESEAIAA